MATVEIELIRLLDKIKAMPSYKRGDSIEKNIKCNSCFKLFNK